MRNHLFSFEKTQQNASFQTPFFLEVVLRSPWNFNSIRLNTSNKRNKKQFVDIFSIYVVILISMKKVQNFHFWSVNFF